MKLLLPVVVLLILGALAAKPVYRAFREWRVDRNVADAQVAFESEDYAEARRLALAVLNFRKQDYEMLRLLQRSMTELGDPRGFDLAMSLMRHEQATDEDRLLGFRLSCEEMPLSSVVQLWISLGNEVASAPEYILPFVTRLIDQNEIEQAASLLLSRSDRSLKEEMQFQSARMFIKAGGDGMLDRGQFEISDIIFNDGKYRLEAFRLLSDVPVERFDSGSFSELDAWIREQADATVDDYLLAKKQDLERYPDRQDEIVSSAIEEFAENDPAAVARWLVGLGRFEDVLELIPVERPEIGDELFRARAQALVGLERWEEMHAWLENPPEKFPALELHSIRLNGPTSIDGSRAWRTEWAEAMAEAESNRNGFLNLHLFMVDTDKPDLANEALAEAVARGQGRLPMWNQVRHLIPWLKEQRRSELLLKVCSSMAQLEPYSVETNIEMVDLGGILGKSRPEAIIATLHKVEEAFSGAAGLIRFREAMATALVSVNRPEKALQALGDLSAEEKDRARVRAILAAVKVESGEEELGRQWFDEIEKDEMLAEEVKFFETIVNPATMERAVLEALTSSGSAQSLPEVSDSLSEQFSDDGSVEPLPEDGSSVLESFGGKKKLPPLPEIKKSKLPPLPEETNADEAPAAQ